MVSFLRDGGKNEKSAWIRKNGVVALDRDFRLIRWWAFVTAHVSQFVRRWWRFAGMPMVIDVRFSGLAVWPRRLCHMDDGSGG